MKSKKGVLVDLNNNNHMALSVTTLTCLKGLNKLRCHDSGQSIKIIMKIRKEPLTIFMMSKKLKNMSFVLLFCCLQPPILSLFM